MKNDIEKLLPKLSIGGVIGGAWKNTKGSKWAIWLPLISVGLLLLFLTGLETLIFGKPTRTPLYEFILNPVVNNFISAPFFAGALMVGILHCRQQKVTFSSGFQYFDDWIQLGIAGVILGLISGIILFVGTVGSATSAGATTLTTHWPLLIALIVNYVLSSLFMLTLPAIADKRLSAIQAIAFSVKKCGPVLHKIVAIFIVNALIMGVAIAACVIPLTLGDAMHSTAATIIGFLVLIAVILAFVWVIPYLMLCVAQIYLKLTEGEA